ncbi:MAG: hypothetical protein RsTaC01_0741 [Candidatus Paraimprobicoccus trichonymphae]|uniref:Uncharacterized protein n=1 Tax=Candidatus Paraimprobicoccus trichonymphae TaxID=3033793 RepID=A0AA48KWC1_9FIRM|nr:MAG: hypothetical protein RsTaC01_0741 [Candidatus Paraimprobicoccus trichonymphae]
MKSDIIDKIVNTDKKSREILAKILELKIDSIQRINTIREKKRNECLKIAKYNIKFIEKREKKFANERIKTLENDFKKKFDRIKLNCDENRKKWINEIINNIL